MHDKTIEPKIDKRIKLLIVVLRRFPCIKIVTSSGGIKKNDGRLNPQRSNEFYIDFLCLDNSSFKIIPIIDHAIAPYSDKVTLKREKDFEEIIRNRLNSGDTFWTIQGKEILPDFIAYILLKKRSCLMNTNAGKIII